MIKSKLFIISELFTLWLRVSTCELRFPATTLL